MHLSWHISQENSCVRNTTILVSKFGCSHFSWGVSHPKLDLREETLYVLNSLNMYISLMNLTARGAKYVISIMD